MRKITAQSLAFLLSLALHAVLSALLWFGARPKPPPLDDTRFTEVELLDQTQLATLLKQDERPDLAKQIVSQSDDRINDEKPKDSRLLSKHDQTVVRETQAAAHGKFRNTMSNDGAPSPKVTAEKQPLPHDQRVANDRPNEQSDSAQALAGDIPIKQKKLKDLLPSFKPVPPRLADSDGEPSTGDGPSTNDDHLKDVAIGMQTLLSTREFVYYSYYNRIKDKLRQYWEPKIKEKMERLLRHGRSIASTDDKITRIVILLDERGTLVRVQVVGPSGVTDLDEAAVEAFRAAAPFPNPPKGIVEADGFIRIRWDFILEA